MLKYKNMEIQDFSCVTDFERMVTSFAGILEKLLSSLEDQTSSNFEFNQSVAIAYLNSRLLFHSPRPKSSLSSSLDGPHLGSSTMTNWQRSYPLLRDRNSDSNPFATSTCLWLQEILLPITNRIVLISMEDASCSAHKASFILSCLRMASFQVELSSSIAFIVPIGRFVYNQGHQCMILGPGSQNDRFLNLHRHFYDTHETLLLHSYQYWITKLPKSASPKWSKGHRVYSAPVTVADVIHQQSIDLLEASCTPILVSLLQSSESSKFLLFHVNILERYSCESDKTAWSFVVDSDRRRSFAEPFFQALKKLLKVPSSMISDRQLPLHLIQWIDGKVGQMFRDLKRHYQNDLFQVFKDLGLTHGKTVLTLPSAIQNFRVLDGIDIFKFTSADSFSFRLILGLVDVSIFVYLGGLNLLDYLPAAFAQYMRAVAGLLINSLDDQKVWKLIERDLFGGSWCLGKEDNFISFWDGCIPFQKIILAREYVGRNFEMEESFFDTAEEESELELDSFLYEYHPDGLVLIKSGLPLKIPETARAEMETFDDFQNNQKKLVEQMSAGKASQSNKAHLSLLDDMYRFKCVNGKDVMFEDFVRWHSPRDWELYSEESSLEPDNSFIYHASFPERQKGRLSTRMAASASDDIWHHLWKRAVNGKSHEESREKNHNLEKIKCALTDLHANIMHPKERASKSEEKVIDFGYLLNCMVLALPYWLSHSLMINADDSLNCLFCKVVGVSSPGIYGTTLVDVISRICDFSISSSMYCLTMRKYLTTDGDPLSGVIADQGTLNQFPFALVSTTSQAPDRHQIQVGDDEGCELLISLRNGEYYCIAMEEIRIQ